MTDYQLFLYDLEKFQDTDEGLRVRKSARSRSLKGALEKYWIARNVDEVFHREGNPIKVRDLVERKSPAELVYDEAEDRTHRLKQNPEFSIDGYICLGDVAEYKDDIDTFSRNNVKVLLDANGKILDAVRH